MIKRLFTIFAFILLSVGFAQAQYPRRCGTDLQFIQWKSADSQFECSLAVLPLSYTKVTHEWLDSYDQTTGLFTSSQPDFSDISNVSAGVINITSSITGVHTFVTPFISVPICVAQEVGTTPGALVGSEISSSTTAVTITVTTVGTYSFNFICTSSVN